VKSIRRSLITGLIGGFGLLLTAGGTALYFSVRAVLVHDFDVALKAKAEAIASLTKQEGEKVELEFAEELMPEFQGGEHPSYFEVWRSDGSSLERSPSLGGADLMRRAGSSDGMQFWDLRLPNGKPVRAVGFAFQPQLEEEGDVAIAAGKPPAYIVVAAERAQLDNYLHLIAAASGIAGIAMIAIAAALAFVVIRNALAPLESFASGVARIDATSLHSRLQEEGLPNELVPMCGRINELLSRLQAAFAREQHFSADVAHELRTPVAELRTLAEVALKWPAQDAETQHAFSDALAISLQMENIVGGLLMLARCESGAEKPQIEKIRLGEFLRTTSEPLAARAESKSLALQFDVPLHATVESDRALLRIIVTNLLSNAVEYSPKAGVIRIAVVERPGHLTLQIANTTVELSSADLPRIFERFWRKSSARTSSSRAGLGLSISKAAAQLLGTKLDAAIVENATLLISMDLPAR